MILLGLLCGLPLLHHLLAGDPLNLPPVKPLSPREEQGTFRLVPGFQVELVACEPDIVDPVAMAFDEDGRLFVAEMIGYPNAGVGTGNISSGRIKLLEDRNSDGYFEKSTVFADGLRFPMAVQPWNGGLIVAVAPDIIFLKDTTGNGRADEKRVLYTGFNLANIQQMVNSLQWGLDNWVYGVAGNNGGTIQSGENPDHPAVTLRNRGIRFHPEHPGSLEPTSSGGQYGLAPDLWQRWFTATNSQHLRHIVLPDHYLQRNPALPVPAVTLDIPDHGAACQVHRISPFEAWRVERTRRRKGGETAKRFSPTELVPGGFITSACSPVIYTAELFPEAYRGNSFVCDPANNLIHRDMLEPNGATFVAKRGDADCEFLASTDNWFRPVFLSIGPDGALYVLDFYREVIETPLSLPDDIKKELNLESRQRGRIWRIVPEGFQTPPPPTLSKANTAELVKHLDDGNSWWRLTAQRLLVERQDQAAVPLVAKLARTATRPVGRVHALWTLHGLRALSDDLILSALRDEEAGVRENALRLADERLASAAAVRQAVVALVDDPTPRVRFQLAFTLGQANTPETVATLARLMRRTDNDSWTQTALLSSAYHAAPGLLRELIADQSFIATPSANQLQLLTRLAGMVGVRASDRELADTLLLLTQADAGAAWPAAMLEGLGQGLQNSKRPLNVIWEKPTPELEKAVRQALPFFQRAATTCRDNKQALPQRLAATRLLSYGPFATVAPVLPDLLGPQQPPELQLAAARALGQQLHPQTTELLLAGWSTYSPSLRREVLEALFARPERLTVLLDAIENQQVLAAHIEPFRLDQLRKHPNTAIRQRAVQLLAGQATPDRARIVADYGKALELTPDATRGQAVFKKVCATCHRLENVGVEVGPDLLSALKTKTPEGLLIDILDPSREVDPRFLNYIVLTKAGKTVTGMIAAETASSLTLRRAEKEEDTVLREQIEEIQATPQSVMPEGLEQQLNPQDVADVIAYLLAVAGKSNQP
ncbi:MAG: PVC-type heme-binding CxxCH protein [Gemmataceae bacterium]